MKTTAFKNTDIGPIPEDWEVKKLGDLMSFKNGFNAPAKAYGRGVPFVSVLDILAPFPITVESILGKVHADASALNSFSVETGDLLFMRSSETQEDVGRSNVFVDSNSPVVFGGFVIRGRPFVEVDSVFLNYLLKDNAHRARVSAKGAGAQHFNIGQIGLADVEITLPRLPEQHRIAAALSDADELVASLDKLIEKKKRVKEGAMQRLLSGETRLPGFTGKWVEKKLGEVVVFSTDTIPTNQTDLSLYVGTDNMLADGMGVEPFKGRLPYDNIREYRLDDILISNIRPYLHKIWLANRSGGCSTDVLVLRICDKTAILPDFLFAQLSNVSFFEYAMSTAIGTKMPRGDKKALDAFLVITPPTLAEQRAIAAVLSDMDAEIAALSRERAEAARIKQGMMQELLTGKTRLAEGE